MKKSLFLILVLLLSACASKPAKKAVPTGLTAFDFWKRQVARTEEAKSLSAKLFVRYTGPKESVSGRGRLFSELPRHLRMELRDPLGRVQYVAATEEDKFTAYYPGQKRAYTDTKAGGAYVRRFLGLPLSFKDMQSSLLGLVPKAAKVDRFSDWKWDENLGAYVGKGGAGANRVTAVVDADNGQLTDLTWETGKETIRVAYSEFSACCGKGKGVTQFAHLVDIKVDKGETAVSAEWDDVAPLPANTTSEFFRVAVPEGVSVTPLQ